MKLDETEQFYRVTPKVTLASARSYLLSGNKLFKWDLLPFVKRKAER